MIVAEFAAIPTELTTMEIPIGSKIVGVTVKANIPYILALIDNNQTLLSSREVLCICSGKPFENGDWEYHGSFLTTVPVPEPAGRSIVTFHILSRLKKSAGVTS